MSVISCVCVSLELTCLTTITRCGAYVRISCSIMDIDPLHHVGMQLHLGDKTRDSNSQEGKCLLFCPPDGAALTSHARGLYRRNPRKLGLSGPTK